MSEKMREAFSKWSEKRDVWPMLTHEEIFAAGWQAALQEKMLTFDQIENCFGDDWRADEEGRCELTAQQLHEFAHRIAALQESEAGAVAWLHEMVEPDGNKTGMFSFKPDNPWSHWMESHKEKCQYTKTPLFLTPPSAQAIETAAIMKCVEVCQKTQSDMDDQADSITDFTYKDAFEEVEARLIALIPQDGRTELAEFGWQVAHAILDARREGLLDGNDIRTIVTNLIGAAK